MLFRELGVSSGDDGHGPRPERTPHPDLGGMVGRPQGTVEKRSGAHGDGDGDEGRGNGEHPPQGFSRTVNWVLDIQSTRLGVPSDQPLSFERARGQRRRGRQSGGADPFDREDIHSRSRASSSRLDQAPGGSEGAGRREDQKRGWQSSRAPRDVVRIRHGRAELVRR